MNDLTLTEAAELLTIGEIGFIEKHFKRNFDELSGTSVLAAVIWAHERRVPGNVFDWADVEKMSIRDVNNYFKPEDISETEAGKE